MDNQTIRFYKEFGALYKEKALIIKELMGSERYKDAYLSHIGEDLRILSDGSAGVAISITKEPRKLRQLTLKIYLMVQLEAVTIIRVKYDSSDKKSNDIREQLFQGTLEEFRHLDLEKLIINNVEDYIPMH